MTPGSPERHALYEASVQSVDDSLAFVLQAAKDRQQDAPRHLCEDFCGTARLAAAWTASGPDRQADGVDLSESTLDWGRRHHLAPLSAEEQSRIQLHLGNVLDASTPPADVLVAFNFSYFTFRDRGTLARYFRSARSRLKPGGLFILDFYGGYASFQDVRERRTVSGRRDASGRKIPAFTYEWEQTDFNAVNHHLTCYIHFDLGRRGGRLRKAFRYDWRLWTLPELRELLDEAGFRQPTVYTHGWDKDGESDDRYRPVTSFDNEESWLAYLVASR